MKYTLVYRPENCTFIWSQFRICWSSIEQIRYYILSFFYRIAVKPTFFLNCFGFTDFCELKYACLNLKSVLLLVIIIHQQAVRKRFGKSVKWISRFALPFFTIKGNRPSNRPVIKNLFPGTPRAEPATTETFVSKTPNGENCPKPNTADIIFHLKNWSLLKQHVCHDQPTTSRNIFISFISIDFG